MDEIMKYEVDIKNFYKCIGLEDFALKFNVSFVFYLYHKKQF
jgi:hypothetical protein